LLSALIYIVFPAIEGVYFVLEYVVCFSSPHKVYVLSAALSSIYIVSTTISIDKNIFSIENIPYEGFKHALT
jgi:hypothetical protein